MTTIFTQTRRSRQTSRTVDDLRFLYTATACDEQDEHEFATGSARQSENCCLVSRPDMTWYLWSDVRGELGHQKQFFGREKLFSCCWARNIVRTLVWLHIHMQCTHVRSYSSMTSFSALMPRLSFNGNHKLWTGFCARGKGQDVVFQVQVTCHLPSYHPSLHERLYVRANVVNCK